MGPGMVLWMVEKEVLTSGNHSCRGEIVSVVLIALIRSASLTKNTATSFSDVQLGEGEQAQDKNSLQEQSL